MVLGSRWWSGSGAALLRIAGHRVAACVWQIILAARWPYLAGGVEITVLNYFLRSTRWRVLLNARGRLPVGTVFWATVAGYMGNSFLPARAGEVVRMFIISGQSELSKTYVLTTALTERLMDAIALVLCGSVVLLGVSPKPAWIEQASRAAAIIAAVQEPYWWCYVATCRNFD